MPTPPENAAAHTARLLARLVGASRNDGAPKARPSRLPALLRDKATYSRRRAA